MQPHQQHQHQQRMLNLFLYVLVFMVPLVVSQELQQQQEDVVAAVPLLLRGGDGYGGSGGVLEKEKVVLVLPKDMEDTNFIRSKYNKQQHQQKDGKKEKKDNSSSLFASPTTTTTKQKNNDNKKLITTTKQRVLQDDTVDTCDETIFDSTVVVSVVKEFLNATVEEIIQFQDEFRISFNLANGISSSIDNNDNESDENSFCDPLKREIQNVTTKLEEFSYNPGVADVPIIAVRLLRRLSPQSQSPHHYHRFLQDDDNDTNTTNTTNITDSNSTTNETTVPTIKVNEYRFVSIVLFVRAACTSCPSDQQLFDDVSSRRRKRRQLELQLQQLQQRQLQTPTTNCTSICPDNVERRGVGSDEVLTKFVNRNSTLLVEVEEFSEVVESKCPESADIYFVDVTLELELEFSLKSNTKAQTVLETLFVREFNDLTEKYCDPYYRIVLQTQIDTGKLKTNDGLGNEIVQVTFAVQIECLGENCIDINELFGATNENDNEENDNNERKLLRKMKMQMNHHTNKKTNKKQGYTQEENDNQELFASILSQPLDVGGSTTTNEDDDDDHHNHHDDVDDDKSSSKAFFRLLKENGNEVCYCDRKAKANDAPRREDFLFNYQKAIDSVQEDFRIVNEARPPPPSVNSTAGSTVSPSLSPTLSPSSTPSEAPTTTPSKVPTSSPSKSPTSSPSKVPTSSPSNPPSSAPSNPPTPSPSHPPTSSPSKSPTSAPSNPPTSSPSKSPSKPPTSAPSKYPTSAPSNPPTSSPSKSPSKPPTSAPSKSPTSAPSNPPTSSPSKSPSNPPSSTPSHAPTAPTSSPSQAPSSTPTYSCPASTIQVQDYAISGDVEPRDNGFYSDTEGTGNLLIDTIATPGGAPGRILAWIRPSTGVGDLVVLGGVTFNFLEPSFITGFRIYYTYFFCGGLDAPGEVQVTIGSQVYYLDTWVQGNVETGSSLTYTSRFLDLTAESNFELEQVSTAVVTVYGYPDSADTEVRCNGNTANIKIGGLTEVEFLCA